MKCSRFALAALGLLAVCGTTQADTIYRSSFEGTDGGWVATGDWQRGVPATPNPVCETGEDIIIPGAFDGTEVWATGLTTCYQNSGAFSTLTQTFDLSLSTSTTLSWQHGLSVFGNFDFVQVFANGQQVYFHDLDDTIQPWTPVTIDLSAFDGNPSVEIQFSLFATAVVDGPGWYLDDIHLEGDLPAPGVNYRLNLAASAPNATPNVDACDITITATVTNVGLDAATGGASFSAPLPGNADFVSGSGAALNMGNIEATIPALASGASHVFTFVLGPNADGTMSVNGNVTMAVDVDTNLGNNTDTVDVAVSSSLPNDNCCAALNLNMETLPYLATVDNSLAFDGPDPGACNSIATGRADFWYVYTAPSAGVLSMNESAGQDVVWGIYTACDDSSPTCLATDTAQTLDMSMGQTVYIQVSAQTGTTSIVTNPNITINFTPPPANDDCSMATTIGSFPFSEIVDNQGATSVGDVGGCENFGDVWYKWTSNTTGSVRAHEADGQSVEWGIYEGADCNSLSLLRCTTVNTEQHIDVFPGITYWFRVGNGTATGARTTPMNLTFDLFTPPPANDNCSGAQTIVSMPFSASVDNQAATGSGDVAGCTNFSDVWYQWTAGADGTLLLNEADGQDAHWAVYEGSDCNSLFNLLCTTTDTSQAVPVFSGNTYTIRTGIGSATGTTRDIPLNFTITFQGAIANDTCATATDITSSLPFASVVSNADANSDGSIAGCDVQNDIWYSFTAPANGVLVFTETAGQAAEWGIYEGSDCNSLTNLLCTTTETTQNTPVIMGNTYKLRLGWDGSGTTATALNFSIDFIAAPANDACSGATVLDVVLGGIENIDARGASNDDDVTCNSTSASQTLAGVWYTFTTGNDPLILNLNESSTTDTVKALFTGSCGGLSQFDCQDAENSFHGLAPNTTYYLLLGAFSPTVRPTVAWAFSYSATVAPANDVCDGATTLDPGMFPQFFSVDAAGVSNDASLCPTSNFRSGHWFKLTATSNMPVTISAGLTTPDTDVAIYQANNSGSPSCNDVTLLSCPTAMPTSFSPVMGQTYYLLIGDNTTTVTQLTGLFDTTFSFGTPPANDDCVNAAVLDIVLGGSESVDAFSANDEPDVACNGTSPVATAGVWYTFTTGLDDGLLNINETGSSTVATTFYTGTCGSLTEIPGSCSTTANRTFGLSANTTYYMLMSTSSATRPTPTGLYNFTFSFTPTTGACCMGETCTLVTATDCANGSGTYLGGTCENNSGEDTNDQNVPEFVLANGYQPIDVPINVTGVNANVTSVSVQLDFLHSFVGDVRAELVGPNAVVVPLFDSVATTACPALGAIGNGDDLDGVYNFIDSATETIRNYALTGPTVLIPSGNYRAADCAGLAQDLNSAFAGIPADGTWTLRIGDRDESITGLLRGWSITLNGGMPVCMGSTPCPGDFNGDDAVDLADLIAFNTEWQPNIGTTQPAGTNGDYNGDTMVDLADLIAFNTDWQPNIGVPCP